MKLYAHPDRPVLRDEAGLFRYSPVKSFLGFSLCLVLMGGSLAVLYLVKNGDPDAWGPRVLFYWLAFVFAILAVVTFSSLRHSFKPSNWVIRMGRDRMLVKFRSYLNDHFPAEDPVVIDLPFSEIEWVRKTRETLTSPSSAERGRIQTAFNRFLDIKLNVRDVEFLKQALTAERNRKPQRTEIDLLRHELFLSRKRRAPKFEINHLKQQIRHVKARGGPASQRTRGHYLHYPVRLVDPQILRIDWSGLWPRMTGVFHLLAHKVRVEPDLKIKTDMVRDMENENVDDKILDLAGRGMIMEATTLTRAKYGYSLAEARHFVESLLKTEENR